MLRGYSFRPAGWALALTAAACVAFVSLGNCPAPRGKVRQTLDVSSFAAETGLRLEPLVIEQHSDSHDGLGRDWPRPDFGVAKHQSYALQWYSFAALAIVLLIVLSTRRAPGS